MWLRSILHRTRAQYGVAACFSRAAYKFRHAACLSLSLWFVAGNAIAQQDPGWRNYVHELGWQIQYPAELFSPAPNPSGLGKTYYNENKSAKLVIFSTVKTADSYQAYQQNLLREPRYRGATLTQGAGWFALSGGQSTSRFFAKFVFDETRYFARAFLLEYDQSQSATYNPIITRLAANFSYEGSNWESEEDRRIRATSRALTISDAVVEPQKTEWRLYENTAVGWALNYPANKLFPTPITRNPGVRIFHSTDEQSTFIVTGGPSRMTSIQDYRDQLISHGRHEDLKINQVSANWFSLTGTRGSRSYFEKYLFSPDASDVQSIALEYPTSQLNEYADIVGKLDAEFSIYKTLESTGTGVEFTTATDRINGVTVDTGNWQESSGDGTLSLTVTNNTNGVLKSVQIDPFRSGQWRTVKPAPAIYPGESVQIEIAVVLADDGKPAETMHRPDNRMEWWDNMHRGVVLSPFQRQEEFKEEVGSWLFGS